jgi:AraC-like DNA-binding protein
MPTEASAISTYILGVIAYSFIVCLILFFQNKNNVHSSRMLAGAVFGIFWYCLIFLLCRGGLIRHLPFIYGYGLPLYYTIPAFCYLYVRSQFNGESKFRKRDWLHFLPAAACLLLLMPLYLSPMELKQRIVDGLAANFNSIFSESSGLVPNSWHFIIRPIQGAIYLVFQWRLLAPLLRRERTPAGESPRLAKWLVLFTSFETLIYAGLTVATIQGYHHIAPQAPLLSIIKAPMIILTLLYIALTVCLFLHPEFLYGKAAAQAPQPAMPVEPVLVPQPDRAPSLVPPALDGSALDGSVPDGATREEGRKSPLLDLRQVNDYALQLEEHILSTQVFRQQGLTVNGLSGSAQIPPRIISHVLNRHYGQTFNEYVNTCRVNYIKERLKDGDWKDFTMEGLAMEAGFSSKSTFFSTFKKQTGKSPAEYVKSIGAITL